MAKTNIKVVKNNEVVGPEDLNKSEKEILVDVQQKTKAALGVLGMIFGSELNFVVAIIPENAQEGKDICYFSNTACPACAVELIVEASSAMKIVHNDGREVFGLKEGEKKH